MGYDSPLFVHVGWRSVAGFRVVRRGFTGGGLSPGWAQGTRSAANRSGQRRDGGPLRVRDPAFRKLQGSIFRFGAINLFGDRVFQPASADGGIFVFDSYIDCDGALPPGKAALDMAGAAFVSCMGPRCW